MRIGDYYIGEPIEYGTTGQKQFYYCASIATPGTNPIQYYNATFEELVDDWDTPRPPYGSTVNSTNRRVATQLFDTNQQFISPGTSTGQSTTIDTINNPYMRDEYLNFLQGMDFPPPDTVWGSQYFPIVRNRYNVIHQTSLYTELLVKNCILHSDESSQSGNLAPLELFTKALFRGTAGAGGTAPYSFVEPGLPYVKFKMPSAVMYDNIGNTSNNSEGFIEYYMLFNTNVQNDQGNILDPDINVVMSPYNSTNNGEEVLSFLAENINMVSFDNSTYDEYFTQLFNNGFIIPTIIGNFQNSVYSVNWEDCLITQPANSVMPFNPFPFPGSYNPNNSSTKAPNYGWTPFSNENITDNSEETLIHEYQDYMDSFAFTGNHPAFFTIDNLYLQDYDILGLLTQNANNFSSVYDAFANIDLFLTPTLNAFLNLITQTEALIAPGNTLDETDISNQNLALQKLKIMHWRLRTFKEQYNTEDEPQNWLATAIWGMVGYNGGLMPRYHAGVSYYNFHTQYGGLQYKMEYMFRMFGTLAPNGYEPKCGNNYHNYFGLNENVYINENDVAQPYGNIAFTFSGGLNVGSTDSINTFTGIDCSQLLDNYTFTGNAGVDTTNAIQIFDLELWKLFYDVQQYNVRIENGIKEIHANSATSEEYQSINIPPVALTPYLEDGYQRYHINPLNINPNEIIQWPFEDLLLMATNPNYQNGNSNFEFRHHPTLQNTFADNPNTFDMSPLAIGITDFPFNYFTGAQSGNPNWRIYRVKKITESVDADFEQGLYTTQLDTLGRRYYWRPEGAKAVDTYGVGNVNPIGEWGFRTPSFNERLNGLPLWHQQESNINEFTPGGVANGLEDKFVQGEYYVIEHPMGANSDSSANNYTALSPSNFGSQVYFDDDIIMNAFNHTENWNTMQGPFDDVSRAFSRRHPSDYTLNWVGDNNILNAAEFAKFTYCHKVNEAMRNWNSEFNTNTYYWYHQIIRHFSNDTAFNVPNPYSAEFGWAPFNPYVNLLNHPAMGEYKGDNRDFLIQLSFNEGGIVSWELNNWVQWLITGCTEYFSNTPPNLVSDVYSTDVVSDYGAFVASNTQIIGITPTLANGMFGVVEFTKSNVPARNWWAVCEYLNQFPELQNGAIQYVSNNIADTEGLQTDVLIYTDLPHTDGAGATIEKGYYPSNPASLFPDTFFSTNSAVYFKMNADIFIETEAFGPPVTTGQNAFGYQSGTSFLSMVNQLILSGIEGETIDVSPEETNGNGEYQVADGNLYLERGIRSNNPDYRPLQLIEFATQNNLLSLLNYFLPPTSSPFNANDTPPYLPGLTQSPGPFISPLPIKSVGVFDGNNSAATIRFDESADFLKHNLSEGFLPGTGRAGMDHASLQDNGYQPKDNTEIFGKNIFTQSTNPNNHPYYFTISNEHPDEASSVDIFDVSWGHINGSGSQKIGYSASPSEAIYRQAVNELLGSQSGSTDAFYSVSQSLHHDGVVSTHTQPPYMDTKTPKVDEYVWILRTKNKLQQNKSLLHYCNLNLSGSDASGNGVSVRLTPNINTYKQQSNGLRRYYLFNSAYGINNPHTDGGVYGYFYPAIGTFILNPKITTLIDGVGTTTVTQFNGAAGTDHHGMLPNGLGKSNKEYNNALKLVNNFKNVPDALSETSNGNAFSTLRLVNSQDNEIPSINIIACIRLQGNEFNFTNNTTRFKELNREGVYETFAAKGTSTTPANRQTMKYNDSLGTSPTTYITHIDLYDKFGYRVATAKLSKPIKKDFNSEVVIKIHINGY